MGVYVTNQKSTRFISILLFSISYCACMMTQPLFIWQRGSLDGVISLACGMLWNLLNFMWHGCFLDTAAIVTSLYFCKCAFSFVCVMWRRHLRLRLHMGGNKIIVCCVPNLVERKREPFKIDPKGFCTTPAAAAFYLERYISVYFSEEKFPMPSCYLANFHRIPFDAICTIFLSGLLHQRIYSSSSQNLK